jgi:uncharacterized protein (DUF849 family)
MVKYPKLILNAALTGMVPTKEQNPALPVTPEEIALDAERVYRLGASIVHVHARDSHGKPTHCKELYREIILRIRERCPDVIITVSMSGRRTSDPDLRTEVLELDGDGRPDMASLTLGSLNLRDDFSINTSNVIERFLDQMGRVGIRPELELFDIGMVDYASFLYKRGVLRGPCYANLLLGSLGTISASPRNLVRMTEDLHEDLVWAATGIGKTAYPLQLMAAAMGGGVRVGLEDCLHYDHDETRPATNEGLVRRIRNAADAMGREVASPREIRSLLGMRAL